MNFRIVNFCGVFIGILMTDKSAKHTVARNALRTITVVHPVSVWWVFAVYCSLSDSRSRVCQWHSVQHLVQQLQRPVQMHLHPAGGVLDALPGVVRTPALHEAQAQDAQPPEIIHTNPCCCREAWKQTFPKSGYRNDKKIDSVYMIKLDQNRFLSSVNLFSVVKIQM